MNSPAASVISDYIDGQVYENINKEKQEQEHL